MGRVTPSSGRYFKDAYHVAAGGLERERAERDKERIRHEADLDAIIDGLGIRAAYENERVIESQWVFDPVCSRHVAREVPVTKFGRNRFLADVKAAGEAARGAEAQKRLADALKDSK